MTDKEYIGVTANQLSKIASDLKAENAKLREESSKYRDLYVHAIADAEAWHLQWSAEHQESAKLREMLSESRQANERLYAEPKRYKRIFRTRPIDVNAMFDENMKLRESVRNLLICIKHEECEESCPNYEPMYNDYGYEKNGSTVVESEYLGCCTVGLENCNSMLFDTDEYLRELGVEVK